MDARSLEQIGPYRVTRYVDEGAFAWVFEVADPRFAGRRLALKMLMPEAAAGEEFRRFETEAHLLAGIDHPNIVTIFDFGKDQSTGNFFYTMTFVEGETLRQRLARGPLSVEDACALGIEILDGLAQLHDKHIVHRDVKPANVLIGKDGRSRLSDLGIARVETERSQTRTGTAVGTALYMSPEQARGRPVDTRSDLFSVGLTLYEALTGNVIYDHVDSVDSTSGMDVLIYIGGLDQQKNAEFKMVFPDKPPIPRSIKRILQKACRLRADDRYQDAREMRDALNQALEEYRRDPNADGIPKQWIAIGGGAAALIAVALGVFFGVVRPGLEVSEELERASVVLDETRTLAEKARAITDAVGAIRPLPAPELLDLVERKIDRGDVYLTDGRENFEAGEAASDVQAFRSAVTYLRDARPHYQDACVALTEGYLALTADDQARTALQAITQLRVDGAAEAGLSAWKKLEALLPGLEAPDGGLGGCEAADAHLARIRTVAEASIVTADTITEFEEAWPRLAEEMRVSATDARDQAVDPSVPSREYRMAVKAGKRSLVYGEMSLEAGDYQAAREAFRSSRESFMEAVALREAQSPSPEES